MPKSLFHTHAGYVRDVNPVFKLLPHGFEIRVNVMSLDFDVMTRPAIFRYEVSGETVRRVQPIAMNGRDFVDEWLTSSWEDSERWASPPNLDRLLSAHDEIKDHWKLKTAAVTSYNFGPVRGCSSPSSQFQVELDRDPGAPSYFRIERGRNSFTMVSVAEKADPLCNGPDLMPKR